METNKIGMKHSKLKIAILGTGNIGTDLLIKIMKSDYIECSVFVGRNLLSKGMSKAINLGVRVTDQSIEFLKNNTSFSTQVHSIFIRISLKIPYFM